MEKYPLQPTRMTNEKGFTLIEMLLVLVIWSIIVLLGAPLVSSIIEQQEEKHFFNQLESDILYVQNMTIGTGEYMRMHMHETKYDIIDRESGKRITRQLPDGWKIQVRVSPVISFSSFGVIKNPGSFTITTKNKKYSVVFRFGKGREYIEES
ncbi:competence type IV pilus minor pilin ComGD [Ornithinibacillus gellani]|uniref:competence type IV pilus minor pilin ComGD n=1 Tax=Ornithinibacillus gellani TaxID=2293253 RepID=UPI0016806DB9|nr:competence type IV pilus minor pilin ComGD [Ornithinibacillus gellani]